MKYYLPIFAPLFHGIISLGVQGSPFLPMGSELRINVEMMAVDLVINAHRIPMFPSKNIQVIEEEVFELLLLLGV